MTDGSYDETDGAQVLKTDVLGRVKTCQAQRERLLDEFERSGLSGTKFAAVAARQVMGMIQQLYAVEEELRQARAGPKERREQRQQRSRPLMESLKQQLLQWRHNRAHLPQSSMGKALSYTLKQWETLEVFLEDERVELNNNLIENAIRPSAIGKKNWLFIGDSEAGVRAATFYTLVGNCQQLGVDAYEYLLDLFTRLPKMTNHQVKEITPQAWAQQKGSDSVKVSM